MQVEVARWVEEGKGTAVGYAAFVVNELVEIRNCTVRLGKEGKLWIALPARPYKVQENGEEKTKWENHIGFRDKEDYWEFQNLAVAAIEERRAQGEVVLPEMSEDVPF